MAFEADCQSQSYLLHEAQHSQHLQKTSCKPKTIATKGQYFAKVNSGQ